MKALYNGKIVALTANAQEAAAKVQAAAPAPARQLIKEEALPWAALERGFQYADGLFETVLSNDQGHLPLLPLHLERLYAGLNAFDMRLAFGPQWESVNIKAGKPAPPQVQGPGSLTAGINGVWLGWLETLARANDLPHPVRYRITAWRQPGGRYAPEKRRAHFLVTVAPGTPQPQPGAPQPVASGTPQPQPVASGPVAFNKVVLAQTVQLSPQPWSAFKTLGAQPYIWAGWEMQQKQADTIILCSSSGHIAESLQASLLWTNGQQWFTPSLQTGCIAGVHLRHAVNVLTQQGHTVQQGLFGWANLQQAQHVFALNAAGTQAITQIEQQTFKSPTWQQVPWHQTPQ